MIILTLIHVDISPQKQYSQKQYYPQMSDLRCLQKQMSKEDNNFASLLFLKVLLDTTLYRK